MRFKNKQLFNVFKGILIVLLLTGSSSGMQRANPSSPLQREVILEIRDYCAGACDRPDKLVYFRLYEDGHAEFETVSEIDIFKGPQCCGMSEHEGQVSTEVFAQIVSLMNQSDFISSRKEYKRQSNLRDCVLVRSVQYRLHNGQKKRILMGNYLNEMIASRGYYPEFLMQVMEKIKQIRERLLNPNAV